MNVARLGAHRISELVTAVQETIGGESARLASAEGEIKIIAFPQATGFRVAVNLTMCAGSKTRGDGAALARRLLHDVCSKLAEERTFVGESRGPIIIRVFPRGAGFDLKIESAA